VDLVPSHVTSFRVVSRRIHRFDDLLFNASITCEFFLQENEFNGANGSFPNVISPKLNSPKTIDNHIVRALISPCPSRISDSTVILLESMTPAAYELQHVAKVTWRLDFEGASRIGDCECFRCQTCSQMKCQMKNEDAVPEYIRCRCRERIPAIGWHTRTII